MLNLQYPRRERFFVVARLDCNLCLQDGRTAVKFPCHVVHRRASMGITRIQRSPVCLQAWV